MIRDEEAVVATDIPVSRSASETSLQLYTVREKLDLDPAGTFARVAGIGYRNVELYGFVQRFDAYRAGLADTGMQAPTAHARLVGQDLPQIFAAAVELGAATVFDPFIDDARWRSADEVRSIADDLNAIAEVATTFGLSIGYHNHAFEFENRFDGVSAFEALAADLDPRVQLQLDTYWAAVGGEGDLPGLLARLGDRVTALHIKDGPLTKDDDDQLAVGQGEMDVPAVLAAAPTALRVVELDGYRGDVFDAVEQSLVYLAGVDA